MAPLPFNTYSLPLSSPRTTTNVSISAALQGITDVQCDFTDVGNPYKIIMQWNELQPEKIVFERALSASHIFVPLTTNIQTVNSIIKAYYNTGEITTFNIMFLLTSANSIDLDLNVTGAQHTDVLGQVIFNIESNTNNIAFSVVS